MAKTQNIAAHLALLGANIIYGLNYVIAKGIMPDFLLPRTIILIRVTGTVMLFWILHLFLPKEKVERSDLFKIFICAIFGVAMNQILFFEGLNLTTPINASIIITLIPVMVIIFSHFIIKEKITILKVSGIILGGAGALIIILSHGKISFSSNEFLGNLLILINASCWALYLVLIKPVMDKYKSFTVMKWLFLFGFVIILPFTVKQFINSDFSTIPVHIWGSIIYVILAATIIGYYLINYSLRSVSPTVNGIYAYLQPLIAATVAIILGKDYLNLTEVIASLLIIMGVYLVSKRSKKIPGVI